MAIGGLNTANLPTNIMDFRGFDSSIMLIIRGGIPRPIGDFPKSLSQAILVGIMLVLRLGVHGSVLGEGAEAGKGEGGRAGTEAFRRERAALFVRRASGRM